MVGEQSASARLVIGADGNQSVCRRFVQGTNEPQYVGAAVWRFFLPGENPFVEVWRWRWRCRGVDGTGGCVPCQHSSSSAASAQVGDTFVMSGEGKVFVMQPTKRDGKTVTYCSGITGFPESRLQELNQTRCVHRSLHRCSCRRALTRVVA